VATVSMATTASWPTESAEFGYVCAFFTTAWGHFTLDGLAGVPAKAPGAGDGPPDLRQTGVVAIEHLETISIKPCARHGQAGHLTVIVAVV
jgi:hypothetical protein